MHDPPVRVVNALATALGISVAELVTAMGYALTEDEHRLATVRRAVSDLLDAMERLIDDAREATGASSQQPARGTGSEQ